MPEPRMWRSNGQRITKQFVARKMDRLYRMGLDVAIDGAYGKYKVTNRKGNRNLSGRMNNAETVNWLDAYEQGWQAHKDATAKEAKALLDMDPNSCRAFVEDLVQR